MITNFIEEFNKNYVGKYLKYFVPYDINIEIQVNEEYSKSVIKNFETKFDKIIDIGIDDYLIRITVENYEDYIYIGYVENFQIFNTNPNI